MSYIDLDAEFNFVMPNGEGTVYNYWNNMENTAEVFVQVSEEIRHFLLIPYVEKWEYTSAWTQEKNHTGIPTQVRIF